MDRVRELFEQCKIDDVQWVKSLLGTQEENETFEFKTLKNGGLPLNDDDKRNLSKSISGFANNAGGLLIWGISTHKQTDIADNICPIAKLKEFHTRLLTVAPQSTEGGRVDLEYQLIPMSRADSGVLVVLIPSTEGEPVRAKAAGLDRYYFRSGSQNLPMSHAQLSDMFGRRPSAKLELQWEARYDGVHEGCWQLRFFLRNSGRAVAKLPAVRLHASSTVALDNWRQVFDSGASFNAVIDAESITFRGNSEHYVHIGSRLNFTNLYIYRDPFDFQGISFDYELFCENAYAKNSMQITRQDFLQASGISKPRHARTEEEIEDDESSRPADLGRNRPRV